MKNTGFLFRIFVGVLISIVTVTFIGQSAYKSLSGIVESVSVNKKLDLKSLTIKDISLNIADAEASVKAYAINKNPNYLNPYYYTLSSMENKIYFLKELSKEDSILINEVGSLDRLIKQKFFMLDQLVELNTDSQDVSLAFQRVDENINQIKTNTVKKTKKELEQIAKKEKELRDEAERIRLEAEERKKNTGLIKKVFSKKEKQAKKESIAKIEELEKVADETVNQKEKVKEKLTDNKLDYNTLESQIKKIKKEELNRVNNESELEIAILIDEKSISDSIKIVLENFEIRERYLKNISNIQAAREADEAKNQIAIFSVGLSLLLLILTYSIAAYSRKNKAYNKILEKAKEQAEKLAVEKENFLADMSHEIRTPMNAIIGFSDQLKHTTLNKEQNNYLEIIKNSSKHLLEVINDVLDKTKIDAGKLSLENIGFKPQMLISEVAETLKIQAEKKQIFLRLDVQNEVPEILLGDPFRLRQIIFNLLGNAIKFTEKGGVSIGVTYKNENQINFLVIAIQDSGIGISDEKLPLLFGQYQQADSQTARKFGGTGLGLNISKKLIELQGGKIEVESELNKGTCFTFQIPYNVGTSKDLVYENQNLIEDSNLLNGKLILIADDEEYNLLLLKANLKKWGVSFFEAKNGKEALELYNKHRFDALLLDLNMPLKNGIEITEEIRNSSLNNQVIIVGLTATQSPSVVDNCLKVGMNAVLQKPYPSKKLYQKLLELFQIENANIPDLPELENNETTNTIDLKELKEISNNDFEFIKEMLRVYQKTSAEALEQIKIGIETNDYHKITLFSHQLSSPSRHLGLKSVTKKLKLIEKAGYEKSEISMIQNWLNEIVSELKLINSEIDRLLLELN